MESRGKKLRELIGAPDILMSTGAVQGMMNTMDAFTDMLDGDKPVERPDLQVPFKDLNALVGIEFLDALEEKYASKRD